MADQRKCKDTAELDIEGRTDVQPCTLHHCPFLRESEHDNVTDTSFHNKYFSLLLLLLLFCWYLPDPGLENKVY